MQPTADWWNVAIDDILAAREARRESWSRLTESVPYRRSELERLKRIAMANLPLGQFGGAGFDKMVSRYVEQFGRRYIDRGAEGWVPDIIEPEEYLLFRGIPASAVAAAFAQAMSVAKSIRLPRGRPGWRALRCWVGLLAEAWEDRFHYPATVTHDVDGNRRGTENERFGRFAEFVEKWVEWALSDLTPAETWWPQTKSARGHMIDAVLKELRGGRKPIKGGPFGAYLEIKMGLRRSSPKVAEQAQDEGSDCPLCWVLNIDRCRRRAVLVVQG